MDAPFIDLVGVDEGLADGESVFGNVGVAGVAGFGVEADVAAGGVVGVELLEEALVGPGFAVAVLASDEAEGGFRVVAGEGGDKGENVVAEMACESGLILRIRNFGL